MASTTTLQNAVVSGDGSASASMKGILSSWSCTRGERRVARSTGSCEKRGGESPGGTGTLSSQEGQIERRGDSGRHARTFHTVHITQCDAALCCLVTSFCTA